MNKNIVGIDWGTSNRRAYLIDQSGACLAEHEDDQGMLAVGGRDQFGASLAGLLAAMQLPPDVPVIMSGMVGSASGWQEVNYLDASVPLEQLPQHLAAVTDPAWAGRASIVPGYVYRNGAAAAAAADVMRGEETQLLGAVALGHRDGWIVLPGTHSKWVLLRDGVIQSIATYMTGEFFAMLSKGGTLSAMLTGDTADAAGFATGLDQAARHEPLTNSLFRVRAGVVSRSAPAEQAAATISGLLIGAEFAAAARAAEGQGITVIGSPALAARYNVAARHFGLKCAVLDPHQVYCTAVSQFLKA